MWASLIKYLSLFLSCKSRSSTFPRETTPLTEQISVLSQSSNLLIGQKIQSIFFCLLEVCLVPRLLYCWKSYLPQGFMDWINLCFEAFSSVNFACFYFTVRWKFRLDQQNTHWTWRFSFSLKCSVSKMLYARAKLCWQITANSRNKFKTNGARKLEKGSKNHTTEKLCDWKPMTHKKAALNLLNHFLLSFLACNARCHFRYQHLSINCHQVQLF